MVEHTQPTQSVRTNWSGFRAGYTAMLPLWLGAVPFGVAYAVGALAAGLTPAQTLVMSLLVFAGSAQFTSVGLFAAGAAPMAIISTTLILNARHLLLAASLTPHVQHAPRWQRALLALQLTDESYAVAIRAFLAGNGSPAYVAGANLSMYTAWPLATLVGIALGSVIGDPAALGLDLVFPLTFIALLVPLLRKQHAPVRRLDPTIASVLAAGALALGGALLLPGSWYILLAGLGAPWVGYLLSKDAAA